MVSFNQKTYVLFTIIILSIIFFICGILHILMKHFLKPIISESEEIVSATAFQGQLQQLFHLHDEGVDQSSIDTLPIFLYKSIIGLKDPFDCVVCLCEFELHDKLRLLPNCSHAFHVECIDAWLLAHSTCPLCRKSLLHECSRNSSSDSSLNVEDDFAHFQHEVVAKDESFSKEPTHCMELPLMNIQYVKLGKFRNVEVCGEGTSRGNSDLKERCFSMGAIEYVMNESTVLQVAIKALKKQSNRINNDGDKFNKESFLAPKIQMGSRREKSVYDDCSRRAFSFRLPKHISDWGSDLEAGGRSRRQKSKVVSHG